ncbi:hypothetical protein ACGFI9_15845 [Micromonospora sp. NPDC048930]|uniref:hypothetical protein n=1 Tax=Micromonospora sp. NPDC048930 TaxID=3364261 RepID=UPI00371C12B2
MRTTEIRVHGVADKGPEAILDRPVVVRVAGDRDAGFYRVRPGFGEPTGPGGADLEAYRWSGLTGGTAIRTLSLVLLLPFMLANIAIWMLPPGRASATPGRALCRLLAASLTAMYVLSAVGVALDLIGWQCAEFPRCLEGRREISWLGGLPPGQRLAILALLPILAVGLVRRTSDRTWQLPEDAATRPQGVGADRLDTRHFWDNRALLRRLRSLHLAIALGMLDLALLLVLVPHDRNLPGYLLLAAAIGLLLAAAALLCLPQLDRRGAQPWLHRATAGARWGTVALTALTVGYAAAPRSPWSATQGMPGYDVLVSAVFATQLGLLLLLAGVVLTGPATQRASAVLGGLGAPVLVSAAIGLAVAFSSGLSYGVAEYLDRGSSPTPARPLPPGAPPLAPPVAYRWAALGFSIAVVLAVVVALAGRSWHRSRRRRAAEELIRQDFPEVARVPPERVRALRDRLVRARLATRLGPLLPGAYALLAVLTLGAAGLSVVHQGPESIAARLGGMPLAAPVIFATDLGGLLIGLFAVVLAGAGLFAYRSPAIRAVGVLWELATFWPRAAHPLAAPCYTERAVPDLTRRIAELTRDGGGVVLSGQSHGSVLVSATVLQLPESCRARVALLTYATPLGPLYRRVFPAYFGPEVLREIGERVDWKWISLWRYTDPIGGRIFPAELSPDDPAAGVDRRVRDPRTLLIPPGDTVPPPIGGHRFEPDEDFHRAVRDLALRLGRPGDGGLRG